MTKLDLAILPLLSAMVVSSIPFFFPGPTPHATYVFK